MGALPEHVRTGLGCMVGHTRRWMIGSASCGGCAHAAGDGGCVRAQDARHGAAVLVRRAELTAVVDGGAALVEQRTRHGGAGAQLWNFRERGERRGRAAVACAGSAAVAGVVHREFMGACCTLRRS